MARLVVIGFENDTDAFSMRAELVKLQSECQIEMEDAVAVTRDANGKVHLHQSVNLTTVGVVSGAFWGTLIGMLLLTPLVGAVVGAGSGALSGRFSDIGINDQFMKDLGATITPGTSALFVLVRKSNPDKVLEALEPFAGMARVLQTSLTKTKEDDLRAVLERKEAAGPSGPSVV